MALQLKRTRSEPSAFGYQPKSSSSDGYQQKSSPVSSTAEPQTEWFGRRTPPPPKGSGYDAFLDWASDGAFDAAREEIDLAITLWMGLDPVDFGDNQSSGPKM